jgi:hypothetical protein
MDTIIVKGILTEDGKIIVDLPETWQAGEVEVKIPVETQATYTEEELAKLLKSEPQSGTEIAEADEIGSWSDIEDSVEFVEKMRRKRREKSQW